MAEKNKQKIEKGDTEDVSGENKVKVESTTSVYQIKDLPIEQFTKVSFCSNLAIFLFRN